MRSPLRTISCTPTHTSWSPPTASSARLAPLCLLSLLALGCADSSAKAGGGGDAEDSGGSDGDTGSGSGAGDGASVADCTLDGDRPQGWADETHGKAGPPDYDAVFDLSVLHTVTLRIDAESQASMYAELETLTGTAFGAGEDAGGGGGGGGGEPPEEVVAAMTAACEGLSAGDACTLDMGGTIVDGTCDTGTDGALWCIPDDGGGGPPDGGGGEGGATDLLSGDPSYVPALVEVDGRSWCSVGMRYKGNATLSQTWGLGVTKLPFRLHFDHYEDEHPEIEDQRFFGFKELVFGNGQGDDTLIREVLASEILADRGIPVARSAFYQVYLDAGEGPAYLGLYTATEDPSDEMMDTVFGDDSGNLYKPDGDCADLGCFDEASFEKKTNEEEADYSDVIAFQAALTADRSDAGAWRAGLEATFDVEGFLRWYAVNTAIENWDTYGGLAHNFYLYGAPDEGGRLTWIPWDHNLSLQDSLMGETAILHETVTDEWPLIRYLLDDAVYGQAYQDALALALAVEGAYAEDSLSTRTAELSALVQPALFGDGGEVSGSTLLTDEAAWESAQEALLTHAAERRLLVEAALSAP